MLVALADAVEEAVDADAGVADFTVEVEEL